MKNNRPYSWMHPNLEEHESKNGLGTFATADITEGTLLILFGGYVLTLEEEEEELPEELSDIGIQVERNFILGPIHGTQKHNGDFVNHSCEPNAGIKGQISLYAIRNIKAGEEITFDYGTVLFSDDATPYELECECGTDKCRGKITDQDWKNPDIQTARAGYFPFYVAEEIEKLQKQDQD